MWLHPVDPSMFRPFTEFTSLGAGWYPNDAVHSILCHLFMTWKFMLFCKVVVSKSALQVGIDLDNCCDEAICAVQATVLKGRHSVFPSAVSQIPLQRKKMTCLGLVPATSQGPGSA